MKKITITREDFEEALQKAINDLTSRDNISPVTEFMVKVIAKAISKNVTNILFKEEK